MRRGRKRFGIAMAGLAMIMMTGCSELQSGGVTTESFEQETVSEIEENEADTIEETQEATAESVEIEPETEAWEAMSLEQLLEEKRYPAALAKIRAQDSESLNGLEARLQELISGDFIVSGKGYVSAKRQDGTALIAYSQAYREEDDDTYPSDLKIASFVEGSYPGAVTGDGKYVTVLRDPQEVKEYNDAVEKAAYENGGCIGVWMTRENEGCQAIYDWTDIALMSAGYPEWGVAITENGLPIHVGVVDYIIPSDQLAEFEEWTDIVDLEAQQAANLVGLRRDGTVVTIDCIGLEDWFDIVALESDSTVIYGLTKDGHVRNALQNPGYEEAFSTEQMVDIVAITAACQYVDGQRYHLVYGLRRDGAVVDRQGQPVEGFTDVVAIDVSDDGVLIGLRADGTMLVYGGEADSLVKKVEGWTDLYIPDLTDLGIYK